MIAILDYGMGNLRSVARAVTKVGGDAEVVADPEVASRADALIVPGVGAFGACMTGLSTAGLDAVVREAASEGKPVLGVCLGLQVLFDGSDETPDVDGLGVLPGHVRAVRGQKVPHMGWNEVRWSREHPYTRAIPDGTRMYFVHSFAAEVGDDTVGVTEYGGPFAAAVSRGSVFATQFHPEKSGEPGLALYAAFVADVKAAA